MSKDILYKISQGMYVLTTNNGGCMVDAVSQVSSGEEIHISVSVGKDRNTNKLIKENKKFILSILSNSVKPEIIKTFGFNSMKDYDKFENTDMQKIDNINVVKDSLGYIECELVDTIDLGSHDLFIGKVINRELFKDEKEMTYAYYQEHKNELMEVKTEKGKTAWVCLICGYVYYGETLPEDFQCPACGVDASNFEKKVDSLM